MFLRIVMPSSPEHYNPSKHHKVFAQHHSVTSPLSMLSLSPGNLQPQEQVVQQVDAEGVAHCQRFTEIRLVVIYNV